MSLFSILMSLFSMSMSLYSLSSCRETRERTSADCWWTADLSKVNSSKFTVSKQKKNQPEKCLPNTKLRILSLIFIFPFTLKSPVSTSSALK